jgi:hypothetical protein
MSGDLAGVSYYSGERVISMIQLVIQVCSRSTEKACSQRAESAVMSDQMSVSIRCLRLFHGQVFWYAGPCTYCVHSVGLKEPPAEAHRNDTTFAR